MSETKSSAESEQSKTTRDAAPISEPSTESSESAPRKTAIVPMGRFAVPVPSGWMPYYPLAYESGVSLLAQIKAAGYSSDVMRWMGDRGFKRLSELTEVDVVQMLEHIESEKLLNQL